MPGAGLASTSANQIALTGTHANTAGYKSGFRLLFPSTENGQTQNVLFTGWYFNGTNIVYATGIGANTTTAGQGMPLAVRAFMTSTGNMQDGVRWQLNGYK